MNKRSQNFKFWNEEINGIPYYEYICLIDEKTKRLIENSAETSIDKVREMNMTISE